MIETEQLLRYWTLSQWQANLLVLMHLAGAGLRVIQGAVTGIGFLCASVIMREGMNISGLTTAASIWAASAIGILLGMGFFFAAITLTLLCASLRMWGARLEPGRGFDQAELIAFAARLGYDFAPGSVSVECEGDRQEWRFVCTARRNYRSETLSRFASWLSELPGLAGYRVTHARN